jgi:hypothetical protein
MAEKKGYATYLTYFGLVLVILTVVNLFVSDVYPEYRRCDAIIDPLYSMVEPGEGITGEQMVTDVPGSNAVSALILRCNNVQNDVFISYVLISIGIAFLVGGLITVRESKR